MATRKYGNTDKAKWADRWFRKWNVVEQWLLMWLFDHADLGGYVELDWEELLEDFKVGEPFNLSKGFDTLAYLTKAIDRLANPTKGFARVHVRRHPIRNDKILVWLTNKAKIECNGKTDLNPGAPFEKAVLTALARFEDYFPVGTIYIGIDRLRNVTLCTRKGKVRKGKVFSREKDERARGKSEAYDKILDNFEHMPIPYKDFVDVCRGYNLTDSQVLVVVHEAIRDAVLMDKGRPDLPLKYLRKQLSDFEVRLARRARIGGQKADLSQVQEEGPRSRPSAEDVEEAMA